jgi:aspartate kinase
MSRAQRQSRFDRSDDVVVMKFGGTSVEDAAALHRLIGIVQSRLNAQLVVVVSALAGVTDQILEAGNASAGGHLGAALDIVRKIYIRHEQLADELVEGTAHRALEGELRSEFRDLEALLHQLDASRKLDLKSQDHLLGFGECLSSRLVTAALAEASITAAHVDARNCIVTDAHHGQAGPVWDATNERIQDTLSPLLEAGQVPVLGGFIAATEEGVPTTLGRGGSDFTAAILGVALDAARIEIWTDVDGVMTADPKLCPEARVIRKMNFDEAADLARFGAKVLHPATLAPAMRGNIPVHVLNSRRPEGEGTEITARARNAEAVSAITAKQDVVAMEIELQYGVNSDLLRAVYAVFERHACAFDLMATSLDRLSLLVGATVNFPAIVADLQGVATGVKVRWENHKALVRLVGENILLRADAASRAFAAVSDMDVHVVSQGAFDRTISFLVEESRVEESVRRLHGIFLSPPEVPRDWGGISAAYCESGQPG